MSVRMDVAVLCTSASMLVVTAIIAIVPLAINSRDDVRASARLLAERNHNFAMQASLLQLNHLKAALTVLTNLVEQGPEANVASNVVSLATVMRTMLEEDDTITQVTLGFTSDYAIAMDAPKFNGSINNTVELKLQFSPNYTCRSNYYWTQSNPYNLTNLKKRDCTYVLAARPWFQTIYNLSSPGLSSCLVATAPEPNNAGRSVNIVIGRRFDALDSTVPAPFRSGVVAADYTTVSLSTQLEESAAATSPSSVMALLDMNNDCVVGMGPASEELLVRNETNGTVLRAKRIDELDQENTLVETFFAAPDFYRLKHVIPTPGVISRLDVDGQTILLAAADIVEFSGTIHWRLILVTPESDFTERIVSRRNTVIWCVVSVCIVLVVAQCVSIYFMMRPLQDLIDQMLDAASMNVEQTITPSNITEIAAIQSAFSLLLRQLSQVKGYLPQSILAKLKYEDDRDETGTETSEDDSKSVKSSKAENTSMSTSGRSMSRPVAVIATLNVTVALARRCVTVMAFNVRHFHAMAQNNEAVYVQEKVGALLKDVMAATSSFKGVVEFFEGDHVFVVFNGCILCAQLPSRPQRPRWR